MLMKTAFPFRFLLGVILLISSLSGTAWAQETAEALTVDERINLAMSPMVGKIFDVIFWQIPFTEIPFILIWLAGAALFLTFYFKFINFRSFRLFIRTIKGRYTNADDPGEISHFRALATALSATVGLGNIAGVALAVAAGGPGAIFWMVLVGLLGMTTKFAECTLGVAYRKFDENGKVLGGPMLYLRRGLKERGLGPLGRTLAVIFSILCIGASLGGGNMFQVNQAVSQLQFVTGIDGAGWAFGLVIAIVTGLVIIGGVVRIASVTSKLVPIMCGVYVLAAIAILAMNASAIPGAIGLIITDAFTGQAVAGGVLGVILQGIKRAAFSNEAGIGSAPIAHATVKTRHPASEGIVALFEPFVDTVIVCTMTGLVIVITGMYQNPDNLEGVPLTSAAFDGQIAGFRYVLSAAVILFAFSTLISWSFYGQQAFSYLFGNSRASGLVYKFIFCIFIVIGASMSLGAVVDFSDAMLLSMCFPNLIGVFILLPVVKTKLQEFLAHAREIDGES